MNLLTKSLLVTASALASVQAFALVPWTTTFKNFTFETQYIAVSSSTCWSHDDFDNPEMLKVLPGETKVLSSQDKNAFATSCYQAYHNLSFTFGGHPFGYVQAEDFWGRNAGGYVNNTTNVTTDQYNPRVEIILNPSGTVTLSN